MSFLCFSSLTCTMKGEKMINVGTLWHIRKWVHNGVGLPDLWKWNDYKIYKRGRSSKPFFGKSSSGTTLLVEKCSLKWHKGLDSDSYRKTPSLLQFKGMYALDLQNLAYLYCAKS